MLPCHSSQVCNVRPDVVVRQDAHGNQERHHESVDESSAETVSSRFRSLSCRSGERFGDIHERVGVIRVKAPVTGFMGLGKCCARHAVGYSEMIECLSVGTEADNKVTHTPPPVALGKSPCAILVGTATGTDTMIALVAPDDSVNGFPRHVRHNLRKNEGPSYIRRTPDYVKLAPM